MTSMNMSLIGMPSSGKSSVGVVLAKVLAYDFLDTDILVQNKTGLTLQEIVDRFGYLSLRQIEADVVLSLDCKNTVISTGGSVVYSSSAMKHLKAISKVVYLKISFEEVVRRLGDYSKRGLAKPKGQTIEELYRERSELYEKYADLVFVNEGMSLTEAALNLARLLK